MSPARSFFLSEIQISCVLKLQQQLFCVCLFVCWFVCLFVKEPVLIPPSLFRLGIHTFIVCLFVCLFAECQPQEAPLCGDYLRHSKDKFYIALQYFCWERAVNYPVYSSKIGLKLAKKPLLDIFGSIGFRKQSMETPKNLNYAKSQ